MTDRTIAATDALSDTRPFTLAAAFLRAHELADVKIEADNRGVEVFVSVKPTRFRHWREDYYKFTTAGMFERMHAEDLIADLNAFLVRQTYFGASNNIKPLTVTRSVVADVLFQLRSLCQARVENMPAWLNGRVEPEPENIIAFRNGLLDVPEWVRNPEIGLIVPTPDWFSVNVLNCDYNPAARCPLWLRVLGECLEDKADLIALLQEWFGYCLIGDNTLQKLLWMHGYSGAGKSTVTAILEMVVGRQNTVSFDLWELAEDFRLSSFLNKRVAIAHDAELGHGNEASKVLGKLKKISAGDSVGVNRKNKEYLDSIQLLTRFVICTNEFPTLTDASDALARRAMFIPFNRQFLDGADTGLVKRLAAELPGITTWAIAGLARLRQQGVFSEAESAASTAGQFRRLQNPVHAFVEDCCDVADYDAERLAPRIEKNDLYKKFIAWVKENERSAMSKDRFASKLLRVVPTVTNSRPREDGGRKHYYCGIRLKEEETEIP